MRKKLNKWLFWIPRITGLLFVAFLMLFSLDVFEMNAGFWSTLLALFMHNIPALILLAAVLVSWRYEIVGGVVFILFGVVYIVFAALRAPWYLAISWSMIITAPAFLTGILFLINWKQKN